MTDEMVISIGLGDLVNTRCTYSIY